MDKKGTSHHWCTFGKVCCVGEVQLTLAKLHLGLLPVVDHRIALTWALIFVSGAVLGEVSHKTTSEVAVSIGRAG